MIVTILPLSNSSRTKIVARRFGFFAAVCTVITSLLVPIATTTVRAQAISRPVPFVLPSRDTTVSEYLPQLASGIAGSHGPLSLDSNGHVIAKDGTHLKFFGTALYANAQFLADSDAHVLAKRLHKLGFNAVRLLYNDYFGYDDASFFKLDSANGKQNASSYTVNPSQVAKFDTLLFELKQNGIYAFCMLNTSHQYTKTEGVQHADSTYYGCYLLQYLDPVAAQLQRNWAKTFLSHVNPLTGMRYADDPQIAVIEFLNDQSLYYYWTLDRLNYIDEADKLNRGKATISYLQSKSLDTSFNYYLKRKYGTDQSIQNSWVGMASVSGGNLLDNGSFENPFSTSWSFTTRDNAQAVKVEADGGVDSAIYEKIFVKSMGSQHSAAEIIMTNLSARLGFDSLYEITFWTKMGFDPTRPKFISRPISLTVSAFGDGGRSLTTVVTIDTTWRKYAYTFRCIAGGLQNLQFQLGADSGDVWLDAVSLHHKAESGLQSGESISTYSVQRLLFHNLALAPLQRIRDQVMFYDSLENSFFLSMQRVVKDTMQFVGLVNYTQSNYWYSIVDILASSGGDAAEFQSGWDYVSARPGKSYTDSTWMVRNTAMLRSKSGGSLPSIAANSRSAKAFSLGEYVVPWPNQNLSEQMLLIPAYASYQGWDAIFFTPYANYRTEIFADSFQNSFHTASNLSSIANNPALLALAPAASMVFRNGLVSEAKIRATILHDPDDLWLSPNYSRGSFWVDGNLENNVITSIGVRQHFIDSTHKVAAQYPYLADTATKHTDTGELTWDQTDGIFTIDAPAVEGGSGFFGNDSVSLAAMSFVRRDGGNDVLSFYYLPLDSLPVTETTNAMLTIATRAQNSGLTWSDGLGFGKNFGTAPILISAAQLTILFHTKFDSTIVYPLDNRGKIAGSPILASRIDDSTNEVTIDQKVTPTSWFNVVHKSKTQSVEPTDLVRSITLRLTQNPARSSSTAIVNLSHAERVTVQVIDDLGRTVLRLANHASLTSGEHAFQLNTASLPSGHYIVQTNSATGNVSSQLSVIK